MTTITRVACNECGVVVLDDVPTFGLSKRGRHLTDSEKEAVKYEEWEDASLFLNCKPCGTIRRATEKEVIAESD